MLYVRGAFEAEGSPSSLINFVGEGDGAGTIVVNYTDTSKTFSIKHVSIKNLSETTVNNRWYSGALNIYGAKGIISDVTFSNVRGEDGLNVKWGHVDIINCHFSNVNSDAIDYDFSLGSVENSVFVNIGNDAVDLGDASVFMRNLSMHKMGDKGISIGDRSYTHISDSQIRAADVGIQLKDDSHAFVDNVDVTNSRIGLHIFQKNPRKKRMKMYLKDFSASNNVVDVDSTLPLRNHLFGAVDKYVE